MSKINKFLHEIIAKDNKYHFRKDRANPFFQKMKSFWMQKLDGSTHFSFT